MSTVDNGEEITFDFKEPTQASEFNQLLRNIIKPGIYVGGDIAVNGTYIDIDPYEVWINAPNSDDNQAVHIVCPNTNQVTPSVANPVIYMIFNWSETTANYPDYGVRAEGSEIDGEILFGTATFTDSVLTGVDTSNKTQGTLDDITDIETNIDTIETNIDTIETDITNIENSFATFIGETIITLSSYKEISSDFPYWALMKADQTMTTANFSQDFIDVMRDKKIVYDPADTSTSSFTGSWSSGVFTLDDTDANNALLDGLSEDYLFQGDYTNFRLVNDGTNDFEISALSVSGLTITVDTTDNTPSGTTIEVYLNRVYDSTTSCYHYSQAGLASYQAGDGKIAGLRHRDQMQKLTGVIGANLLSSNSSSPGASGVFDDSTSSQVDQNFASGSLDYAVIPDFNSANSPDARTSDDTDGETMMRSTNEFKYVYVEIYVETV